MNTTKNTKHAEIVIESFSDSYVKVIRDGRAFARADLLSGGKWRLWSVASGASCADAKEVSRDMVAPWVAMQALLAHMT